MSAIALKVKEPPSQPGQAPGKVEGFAERHFAEIAFAVSALVLWSTAFFWVGLCLGAALHYKVSPGLQLRENEKICNVANTTLAFVGMMAVLVQSLALGAAEVGLVFKFLHLIGSAAVGSTLYRGYASFKRPRIPEKK